MSATNTAVFAAFTFVPPTTDVLQHRAGTLAVAVAATCSWLCCIVLLSWISYLLYGMYRKHQSETTSRYAFLRTQFGMLFANLLVADLMQSTAFGLNYYWFFTKKRPQANVSHVCAVQAIGIQSGDLASAIWSFIIALHTITFLVWRYKVPNKVAVATVPIVWTIVLLMTSIGPIHVHVLRKSGQQDAGSFYNSAGLWCWIGIEYESWRIYNHYLFVFLSAFGSLTMYGGVFLYLWFRLFQRGMYNHQLFQLRRAADGRIVPTSPTPVLENHATFQTVLQQQRQELGDEEKSGSPQDTLAVPVSSSKVPRIPQRVKDDHAAERNRKVDRAALLMLLFPACYILSILPLASYRLARISKQPWSYNIDVQAGCGVLFSLGGTFNAILYTLTRKIFQSSGKGSSSPYNSGRVDYSTLGPTTSGPALQSFHIDLSDVNGSDSAKEQPRKGSVTSLTGSGRSSPFPSGMNVGRASYNPWQPAAMLFARKLSTDSGRRRSSGSLNREQERTERMPSVVSSNVGGRPSIQRKPSGLGQSVHFASGHQGRAREDGTWDDGLSFEDSTDAGHSIYELSQEEVDSANPTQEHQKASPGAPTEDDAKESTSMSSDPGPSAGAARD